MQTQRPVYYKDYLQLNKLLNAQACRSKEVGRECHDETLFIIVHQAYELWFKQIIHELDSILQLFSQKSIPDFQISLISSRLERIIHIQKVLVEHLVILETMTPMDFLEFRNLLIPASGFQSIQFRAIETKLGLNLKKRDAEFEGFILGRLKKEDKDYLVNLEKNNSLFELVEKWLERVPFIQYGKFNFWREFQKSVTEMLKSDRQIIEQNPSIPQEQKDIQLQNLEMTKDTFFSLFDPKKFQDLIIEGKKRLSQKATLGALFVMLYRDEPLLYLPFKVLNSLMDIDENFIAWRQRHALMAQRMLGMKIGTGGSSGHDYLKKAAEKNKIFQDLFNLSSFLIPRSQLPSLPEDIKKELNFFFSEKTKKSE
jgi:tryptophan 2,3-dioxygenase